MTRRVGKTLLALLLVLILALGICEWAGWPFLRGPIERTLSNSLDRPVTLGEGFRLRLLGPIRVSSDLVQVGAAEGAPAPDTDTLPEGGFLHAVNARLELPWSTAIALARGSDQAEPPTITALEIERLDLALARTADGKANWSFGDESSSEEEADTAMPAIPRFERLVVQDGRIVLDDEILDLQLEATIRTSEGSGIVAAGTEAADVDLPAGTDAGQARGLVIEAKGSYQGDELEAKFETSGVLPLIAATQAGAPPLPLEIDLRLGETQLALEGQAVDLLQLTNLEGSYRLEGASLADIGEHAGLTLPATGPLEIHGTASKNGEVYATKVEGFRVGSSRLSGQFEFDPTPEIPKLSGVLSGERLALADLAPAFGADPPEEQKPRKDDGRVLPQEPFDLPSLANMEADLKVDLESADFGTDMLRDLAPLTGRIVLRDQVLAVEDLVARTADGELRGRVSLDARKKAPLWHADLQWGGIELERFITARNPRNTEQSDSSDGKGAPGYVTGTFGGRADLRGVGNSTARMLASLDGAVDLWVTDGTISHLLLELMGLDVAQSLGLAFGGDQNLTMRCAVTRLEAKDGLVRPEVALIDTTDTTVMIDGEVSLAQERMELVLSARPKDVSPVALRAPVHVGGTFADPAISPDVATIGLRIAGAAVLAAINPLASLLALFDTGDPNTAACAKALEESGAPPGEGTAKGGGEAGEAKPETNTSSAQAAKEAGRNTATNGTESGDARGVDKPGVGDRYRETPPVKPGVN